MVLDYCRERTTPHDDGRERTGRHGRVKDPRAYVRLAALLREQIESGALAPGDPAPSITTLTQEHGLARQTVAKAFGLLLDEGLVVRVPGLGYYVAGR
jgi:DNA-binding GntR family transcriptional regulator